MEFLTLTGRLISVITVLIVALFTTFFHDVIDNLGFTESYVVIIGILSSPENFESRSSIRQTWLNSTSDFSLSYHFVIGEHLCNIHPSDRVSPYSCVENQLAVPENATADSEFSVLSPKRESGKKYASPGKVNAIGFGFQTLRSITIKKLGVIKDVFSHVNDVRVKLRSSETGKTLASVTISRELDDGSDVIAKSIRPLPLEPNVEIQLIVEFASNNLGFLPSCDTFQWNYAPGVINYLQLIHFGERKPWPFSSESCSYGSMNYTTDVDMLVKDMYKKEERRNQWRRKMEEISRRLKNESYFYGDITFVDVVDVYRTLPIKLIQFFRRLTETEFFHYVLKTDDDCFIDVERVYRQLVKTLGLTSGKLWWWSKYREFWRVQEAGKWREDEYRSVVYPSFPCGGGYVVSKRIVDYLSKELNLRLFQGEDVSMGIWLSALKTVQHRSSIAVLDNGIQERIIKKYGGNEVWSEYFGSNASKFVPDVCEWTCDNERTFDIPQCNRVQLTPAEMREVWDMYRRQGYV